MIDQTDHISVYAKARTRLTIVAVAVVSLAVVLHFVFGKLRYQETPLVAVDGMQPEMFSYAAVGLLFGAVIYIFLSWKCPKCHGLMCMNVRSSRYKHTFDLDQCPNCNTPLKKV